MTDAISISIDISRAKEALARARPVMEARIEPELWRGAEEVAIEAKGNAPKAFSNLVNSIRAERIDALHYQVVEGVRHGRPVEEGADPHGVDSEKLIPWVQRVLGFNGKEARDKAFLIARAIRRRGTRAQPYMQPAAEAKRSRLFELVQQGVDQGIKEVFG